MAVNAGGNSERVNMSGVEVRGRLERLVGKELCKERMLELRPENRRRLPVVLRLPEGAEPTVPKEQEDHQSVCWAIGEGGASWNKVSWA